MGVHQNIDYNKFPKQGNWINKRVRVCFNYNSNNYLFGKIVRDDAEEPNKLIIELDNGTYILSSECQYSLE